MVNIKVSDRLNLFNEYVFSKLGRKIKEVEKKSGRKVLNFGPGNPDFPPSQLYIKKYAELIKNPNSHLYPGFGPNHEFTEALISWYKKRFDVELKDEQLFPLLGAKDGVSHLPLALLNEGDEVLIPDPGYPAFTDPALMIGGKAVYYNLTADNNFKISLKELEEKISNKTKFIWINFPSNPTGQVVTIAELERIVIFARKHNILIVYDNAYSEITFDDFIAPSILQIDGSKDIAVELGSFSKTFSFAGFRMGWIVGNQKVINALAKIKSQMDSGLSTPLQNLGAFVLTNTDTAWHKQMLSSYEQRRNTISLFLKKMGLEFSLPRGGLYIWAKIPKNAKNTEGFCMKLLEEKQILFTPGTAFGKNGDGYVRVSFCINIDKIGEYS